MSFHNNIRKAGLSIKRYVPNAENDIFCNRLYETAFSGICIKYINIQTEDVQVKTELYSYIDLKYEFLPNMMLKRSGRKHLAAIVSNMHNRYIRMYNVCLSVCLPIAQICLVRQKTI